MPKNKLFALHKINLNQLHAHCQITGTQEITTSAKHLGVQSYAQLPLAFPF